MVYLGMKAHSECVGVQVSGSACVFNLTSLELAEGMSQRLLGDVMRQIINTMRNFPDHKQVHTHTQRHTCILTFYMILYSKGGTCVCVCLDPEELPANSVQ